MRGLLCNCLASPSLTDMYRFYKMRLFMVGHEFSNFIYSQIIFLKEVRTYHCDLYSL